MRKLTESRKELYSELKRRYDFFFSSECNAIASTLLQEGYSYCTELNYCSLYVRTGTSRLSHSTFDSSESSLS